MNPNELEIIKKIIIPLSDWETMLSEVERYVPEEACGVLLGKSESGVYYTNTTIPVTNVLHSRFRFRMDPLEQLAVFNKMEDEQLKLIGIYHSHPEGPEFPSALDVAESYYPEAVHLIWSRTHGRWKCSGYWILDKKFHPVAIQIQG